MINIPVAKYAHPCLFSQGKKIFSSEITASKRNGNFYFLKCLCYLQIVVQKSYLYLSAVCAQSPICVMIARSLPKTIPFPIAWISLSSTKNCLASPPLQNLNVALPTSHHPVSFPAKIGCTTSLHFFLNLLLIILSSPLTVSYGHLWPLFFF